MLPYLLGWVFVCGFFAAALLFSGMASGRSVPGWALVLASGASGACALLPPAEGWLCLYLMLAVAHHGILSLSWRQTGVLAGGYLVGGISIQMCLMAALALPLRADTAEIWGNVLIRLGCLCGACLAVVGVLAGMARFHAIEVGRRLLRQAGLCKGMALWTQAALVWMLGLCAWQAHPTAAVLRLGVVVLAPVLACGVPGYYRRELGRMLGYEAQFAELYSRATVDGLTGLLNKMTAEERVRCRVHEGGVLLMVDVDDFKQVNDRLGHAAGDKLLQQVAQALRQVFRDSDVLGRFGGDEFLVFAPGGNMNEALARGKAEELCELCRGYRGGAGASVSLGVLLLAPGECFSFADAFACADSLLYQAKRRGKDAYALAFYADVANPKAAMTAAGAG